MAIYRTICYFDMNVTRDGRMTVPKNLREQCGFREGDTMTVRVEENPQGVRQLVMWKKVSEDE